MESKLLELSMHTRISENICTLQVKFYVAT